MLQLGRRDELSPAGFDGGGLALVLEQAADLGGQERVVEALLWGYPAAIAVAPAFRPTNRPPGRSPWWESRVRYVGGDPRRRRRGYLVSPYARRLASVDLTGARVVMSIAHGGWSLAAHVPPGARHVCYSSGLSPSLYGNPARILADEARLVRPLARLVLPAMRAHERQLMQRPDRLIANSHCSARALASVHGRSFEVVHPPVRTGFFRPGPGRPSHFLVVARVASAKQVDIAVEAFRGLDDELVVAGGGPALERLRRAAPPNVRFTGPADDATLLELFRSSRALISPSVESFGIAMCESLACGKPVIAPARGGALEIVRGRETGLLLDRVDPRSIAEAVRAVPGMTFSARACRTSVAEFDERRFRARIDHILADELARAHKERPAASAGPAGAGGADG